MTEKHHKEDVPDDTMVPLTIAHVFVNKSSSSVYRWVKDGKLATVESSDGLLVRVGDVRAVKAAIRHGGRRVTAALNKPTNES